MYSWKLLLYLHGAYTLLVIISIPCLLLFRLKAFSDAAKPPFFFGVGSRKEENDKSVNRARDDLKLFSCAGWWVIVIEGSGFGGDIAKVRTQDAQHNG